MRVIVQRTTHATVSIEGKIVGQIEQGFMLLVGITHTDTKTEADYLKKWRDCEYSDLIAKLQSETVRKP